MSLSGHSLSTTFGAPPAFGGAPARDSEAYHLTVDGVHVASLHAVRSSDASGTVRAALTIYRQSMPKAPRNNVAHALSLTREIEDFRDGSLPNQDTRAQKCRDDAHAGDGLPRALLIVDRLTGLLRQSALPMPREVLPDGLDRYEVICFAVLERGARTNLEIGDANAYLTAPEFSEKKTARLLRKHRQDVRSDRFQVRRHRREVSLADAERVSLLAPADSESRLDALRTMLAERQQAGMSRDELRAIVVRELRAQRPEIGDDTASMLAGHVVSQLPAPDERRTLPDRHAPRHGRMPREVIELAQLWACAVCASAYADATLEPLGMPNACREFSLHDYAAACELGRTVPRGTVALLITDAT